MRITSNGAILSEVKPGCFQVSRCGWLIRVPSNHPEPDFPEDLYNEIECGEIVRFDAPDGERCDNGHEFGNLERRWTLDWYAERMEA